jgi:hypothetical protein
VRSTEAAKEIPATMRVPIRFGRLRPLFLALGITPGRSYLELSEDVLGVRLAWSFGARVARTSIRSAQRVADSPYAIGVHGWSGRWIVNGAAGPMVSITIEPPACAYVLGFRVSLRELVVSVDEPDELVSMLETR